MSEEPLSIVTDWPSTKTELLSFLRKQSPDLGPFVCRDAAAIIEHLDSSLGAAEARVAALTQENERLNNAIVAHHELSTLSDEAIAEAYGPGGTGACPICKRAALGGLVGLHEQEQG